MPATPKSSTTKSAATELPAAGSYRIDPSGSSVSFSVRYLFGLQKTTGTFDLTSGEIVVADSIEGSSATAAISAGSFTTGTAKRDKHVRTDDFLAAETYPEISFTSSSVVEQDGTWMVKGVLSVKGKASPLDLAIVEIGTDGDAITARATTQVDRHAAGVSKMKGMVAGHLDTEISVRAVRL